jgi:hypothetical protein
LDSLSFGGFGISLLEGIADEYPKSARVDFTLLDDYTAIMGGRTLPVCLYFILRRTVAYYTTKDIHKSGLLTNALSLFNLINLSDLSIPLLPRAMWEPGPWSSLVPNLEARNCNKYLGLQLIYIIQNTLYHTSAIYSAHVESISWPIRCVSGYILEVAE